MSFPAGTAVLVKLEFVNILVFPPVPADPETITLKFASQGGHTTTWTYAASELTRTGVGLYQTIIDTTPGVYGLPGAWMVEALGGPEPGLVAVGLKGFNVSPLPL